MSDGFDEPLDHKCTRTEREILDLLPEVVAALEDGMKIDALVNAIVSGKSMLRELIGR